MDVAKIQCGNQRQLVGSLIINGVNIRHPEQGAVLDEVRSRSVTGRVPQTAAADLHALSTQLADVHQDNDLVSGNQQVLYAGSDHLSGGGSDSRVFKRCCPAEFLRLAYLAQRFCHFL